jgi:hypothetical protein
MEAELRYLLAQAGVKEATINVLEKEDWGKYQQYR